MINKIIIIFVLLLLLPSCEKDKSIELFSPDFEVMVLLPVEGLGDRSFVDIVYQGVEDALQRYNFKVTYLIPDSEREAAEWIGGIASIKRDNNLPILLIVAGNQYAVAIDSLDGNFGNSKVLLLAGDAGEQKDLASVVYRSYASSYIGGYLSAKHIAGCRAIAVEAFDAPFLKEYSEGFAKGVADAGGLVSAPYFLSDGFEGFSMVEVAHDKADSLLDSHNLIFGLAAGSNLGIINAARSRKEKKYVIGVDSDQSWMGLNVVTGSVLALFGLDIDEYIGNFSKGSFKNGRFRKSITEGRSEFKVNHNVFPDIVIPRSLIDSAAQYENQFFSAD